MNDPYFDFREYYVKGDTLYYLNINELVGIKEIVKVTVRTIYPRAIIGQGKNAQCYVIGYRDKDMIFRNKEDAQYYIGGET